MFSKLFLLTFNVTRTQYLHKRRHTHYRTEAVTLDGYQLSKSSTYLNCEHHLGTNQAFSCDLPTLVNNNNNNNEKYILRRKMRITLRGAGYCTSAKRMTSILRHVAEAFPPARQGTILNSHRVTAALLPIPQWCIH